MTDILTTLYPLGVWHQHRWAGRRWRAYEVYVPPGSRPSGEVITEALLYVWARLKKAPIWAALLGEPRLIWRISADGNQVRYLWLIPERLTGSAESALEQAYRGGALSEVEDPGGPPAGRYLAAAVLRLAKPPAYSLKGWAPAHPIALRRVLERLHEGEAVTLDCYLRAIPDGVWKPDAHREYRRAMQLDRHGNVVTKVEGTGMGGLVDVLDTIILGGPATGKRSVAKTDKPDRIEQAGVKDTPDKITTDHGFAVEGRVLVTGPNKARVNAILSDIRATYVHMDAGNRLYLERSLHLTSLVARGMHRRIAPVHHQGRILGTAELASLLAVAPPAGEEGAARVIELRQAPPARQPGDIHLVDAQYRGKRVPVYVGSKTLCDHMAVMGRTGSGKGVLLLRWCMELAEAGYGFASLWPLKRDARALLAAVPENRKNDVIYFEVGHETHVLPLNLLAHDGSVQDLHQTVTECMNIAFRLWADSWGKSMERYLRMAFYGAAALRGTVKEAIQVLTNEDARLSAAGLLPRGDATLEEVERFLETDEFSPRDVDPAVNKLQELLLTPSIAPMVTQRDAPPWREWALGGKIVIGVLNQEELGDLPAALAAGTCVSQLHRSLMRIPSDERRLFPILYDEFRFVSGRGRDTWERAFKQLRQFLSPQIAALQDKGQFQGVAEGAFRALSGAGNAVVLGNAPEHAEDACRLVGEGVTPRDIANVKKRSGYANLVLNDEPTGTISVWAPEPGGSPYLKQVRDPDQLITESMGRYLAARRRGPQVVEEPQAAAGRPRRVIMDE